MSKFSFLIVIAVIYSVINVCYGQEGEDEESVDVACLNKPQNKKVLKLLQNSSDRKKKRLKNVIKC